MGFSDEKFEWAGGSYAFSNKLLYTSSSVRTIYLESSLNNYDTMWEEMLNKEKKYRWTKSFEGNLAACLACKTVQHGHVGAKK